LWSLTLIITVGLDRYRANARNEFFALYNVEWRGVNRLKAVGHHSLAQEFIERLLNDEFMFDS
jgi:hypothetical protein